MSSRGLVSALLIRGENNVKKRQRAVASVTMRIIVPPPPLLSGAAPDVKDPKAPPRYHYPTWREVNKGSVAKQRSCAIINR